MLKDILARYGKIGVELLKAKVSTVSVTRKTASSIRYESDENSLQLIARGYFEALETGRAPRKSNEYGGFDLNLDEWLRAKGFSSKTSKAGIKYYKLGDQWFSAKSLAWKINKTGDRMWRKGRGAKVRDVYSIGLQKFVDELTEAVKQEKAKEFKKKVLESFKEPVTV